MIDKEIDYRVEYRSVKNPRLEFRTRQLTVILPHGHDPEIVLARYKKWILKKHRSIQEGLRNAANMELSARSSGEFKDMVHLYVADVCGDLSVKVNKIGFRKMRTKWASCSSRNNLTFNTLMARLPDDLVAYIVLHEVAHLKERNHKKPFHEIVERYFHDHKSLENDLHTYWYILQDS